ncbi:hypothetical protein QCA50_010088 [Cerrena zonata]|uniref:Protein kinase domain-containing protein n=1 Tax=Cerrena zonata TaxID=2478898 RepID=A0AAW0GA64_9APHY
MPNNSNRSFLGRLIPKSDKDSSSDGISTHFTEALARYLEGGKEDTKLINLRGSEVQPALQYMQRLYDEDRRWETFTNKHCKAPAKKSRLVHVIVKLSQQSGELPQSLYLRVNLTNRDAERGGGFADIFRGRLRNHDVALKRLRYFCNMTSEERQQNSMDFAREALLWRQMKHENVLEFHGIDMVQFPSMPCMVLPWVEHGNIRHYMKNAPSECSVAQRNKWLSQTANGLTYLHEQNVVHGDVRGANIMISLDKIAKLADFGLSVFAGERSRSFHSQRGGVERWMAPELLDPDLPSSRPTKMSDVYSFGVLCCEIYSASDPYWETDNDKHVGKMIVAGVRPTIPSNMDNWFSALATECWNAEINKRPTISDVAARLSTVI